MPNHLFSYIILFFSFTATSVISQKIINNNILIEGNHLTKKEVVFREIGLNQDDNKYFGDSLKILWIQRISDLGLFTHVDIQSQKDSIFIFVKEKKYNWFLPEIT